MNKSTIALKYLNSLPLSVVATDDKDASKNLAASLSVEMMRLGYVPSKLLFEFLENSPVDELTALYNEAIPALQKMKGADVKYKPMYPNFPQQVMEASDVELFVNAILHYWTAGRWQPEYETLPRELLSEDVTFVEIDPTFEEDFKSIFTTLLSSKESISATDKTVVAWFLDNYDNLPYPAEIPFKENMACVAGYQLVAGKDITPLIKTTTDVLRVMVGMSNGDVSLAENTKFRSQKRRIRRAIVEQLERVASEEDFNRHRGQWVRALHSLHIGDYSKRLYKIAKKLRENEKIETFNGSVQAYIDKKDVKGAVSLLKTRPSEFARRLDHLLRLTRSKMSVIDPFLDVVDRVPTRVLMQLMGNLKVRSEQRDHRVVFPKGQTQKAVVLDADVPALSKAVVTKLLQGIMNALVIRFGTLDKLGKVYIDESLRSCPIPTQQRSASEGLFQVGRGTRLPIGDKGTLRFFIYWVGDDIDLSATLHDENFNMIEQISYTHLRSHKYQSAHSGDITYAPKGASEFIDITIDPAVKYGARYVVMNVFVYNGPNFGEHKKCYAGWMTREKVQSGEVYEPKTVQQKVDLTAQSRNAIPVVFDLVERKAIWTDLSTKGRYHMWGNNTHSNQATIEQTLRAMVSLDNKVTLYELFTMHAHARGTIVDNRDEADVIFAIDEGITPYDIATINSEYLV